MLLLVAVVLGIDLLRRRNLPSSGRGRRTWRRRRRDTKVGRNIYSIVRLFANVFHYIMLLTKLPFFGCAFGVAVIVSATAVVVAAAATVFVVVVVVVDDDVFGYCCRNRQR